MIMERIIKSVKVFIELSKIRVALLVSVTAFAGFVVSAGGLSPAVVPAVAGTFLLACGALALNQYQERRTDALMDRTRSRPLPSGRTGPLTVVAYASSCIVAGFLVMLVFTGTLPAVTGLAAVCWYNTVYLFLKRRTAFASIPGSLAGALPVLIGSEAASGRVFVPGVLLLAVFMIVWQMPHFWMIVMKYGEDYERAGLPSLTGRFTSGQISRITFVWVLAAAMLPLLMPLYGLINSPATWLILIAVTLVLLMNAAGRLLVKAGTRPRKIDLAAVNLYALAVMLIIVLDSVLRTA